MSTWGSIRCSVLERDNYKCRICGKGTSGQVHHIAPKRSGGTEELSNLVTLCGRCHMLLSPVPDFVISRVWEIPLNRVDIEKARVRENAERLDIYRASK